MSKIISRAPRVVVDTATLTEARDAAGTHPRRSQPKGNAGFDGWQPKVRAQYYDGPAVIVTKRPVSTRKCKPEPSAVVCPGCGITPPPGRKCPECWDLPQLDREYTLKRTR